MAQPTSTPKKLPASPKVALIHQFNEQEIFFKQINPLFKKVLFGKSTDFVDRFLKNAANINKHAEEFNANEANMSKFIKDNKIGFSPALQELMEAKNQTKRQFIKLNENCASHLKKVVKKFAHEQQAISKKIAFLEGKKSSPELKALTKKLEELQKKTRLLLDALPPTGTNNSLARTLAPYQQELAQIKKHNSALLVKLAPFKPLPPVPTQKKLIKPLPPLPKNSSQTKPIIRPPLPRKR